MLDKKITEQLLKKEITRRQFLQGVGLLILGVLGVNSFVSSLSKSVGLRSDKETTVNNITKSKSSRFGHSRYGV